MRTEINRIQVFLPILVATTAILVALTHAADDVSTQKPEVQDSTQRQAQPANAPKAKPAGEESETPSDGPVPMWIWAKEDRSDCLFNKRFEGGAKSAQLTATCDNHMVVYLNGKRVATSGNWEVPVKVDVAHAILPGVNQLLVEARNQGGPSGFALKLSLTMPDGSQRFVVTDKTWKAANDKEASTWSAARVLAKMGAEPWGDVFTTPKSGAVASAGDNVFQVLPGFQVELLYTVPKGVQGSWVSICFDNKGRLIASDQGKQGLYRITPPPIGSEQPTRVEKLNAKITSAQGLLYAFNSLYVSVNGGPGSGLYRLRDTNGDDQFDEMTLLKKLAGVGEHGPHAVRLSPDGKSLYVIAGNHTNMPELGAARIPTNWSEDLLLPRQWDARGHARGRLAPGGWICKTDPDGKQWEVVSIGYRNAYDMDFNADGELFAYDADMEWDMGTPWYRPTRLSHATSGSEFGWRSGTGKWPSYFVDSLPELVDIGPGSPVGATFGYGTKFPAKYQKALYLLDWTFGTMYAIHLEPQGASYRGVKEEFVSRTPLPLTDAAVGPDGALYFTVGGRGTQSALYRVTYTGKESTAPVDGKDTTYADLRALRKRLEEFHASGKPEAIDYAWPHLGHADRHIRYAARLALEHQDTKLWSGRALTEKNPLALITAVVGLARQGDKELQGEILTALGGIDFGGLNESQQLELLRAYALTFIRMGQPQPQFSAALAKRLDPFYPADSNELNRELSRVLVYLNSPTVIDKTLELMEREYQPPPKEMAKLLARNQRYGGTIAKMLANQPEIEKIHFALALRNLRYGWTLEQRKKYFAWLDAATKRSGGASYQGFIKNIRSEALAKMSEAEKKALASTIVAPPPPNDQLPKPKGPGQEWSLEDIRAITQNGLSSRNFENGVRTFAAARCVVCHRFDGNGGATGHDLTNVAGRFSFADLAESIIDPSKIISDQYLASLVETNRGAVVTGRILSEDEQKLTIMTDPEDATKIVEISKSNVAVVEPSKVSLMPKNLLDVLNEEEVLDLLAYLMSRGNPDDPIFAK